MRELPDNDRRKFEQIADVLTADVRSGRLRAGEKLPSVRKLREEFDVSEGTVLNALRVLRERGIVRRDSTRGHFVAAAASGSAEAGDAAATEHSPEYVAIMSEVRELRGELQRLAQRLEALENTAGRS